VRIDNRLQVGPARDCAQWRNQIRWQVDDRGREAAVVVSGTISAGCAGERYFAALDHPTYSASLIRQLWLDLGGQWQGGVRFESVPVETLMLAQSRSPELPLILRDINKFSNNLMARQLYLTLGAVLGKPDDGSDTAAKSAAVIRRWLAGKGWSWPELVLENGSGLSRNERISARHLADLLLDAGRGPLSAEFIAALPIAGLDGTMKKRLQSDPLAGQAHIKTGTLKDVRALAGYVRAADGSQRVVVAILNHPRAAEGVAVLDEVLRQARDLPVGNSARP
jgi:D-alanyl-D-alanine carboxypeptidase/D-alanyl-D-alanine-endopeptidase (penicillin-binding protein 4)